jgi:ElaB/YqjD/DUF883 family membrane-anchored ribosome-binding protein
VYTPRARFSREPGSFGGVVDTYVFATNLNAELSMSSTNGEDAMKGLADDATYERLQKDVDAVKDDISKLAEQLSDALDTFTTAARKGSRSGYKQARSNLDSMMSGAAEKGNAALSAAQDAAGTLEDTVEDAIVQRPLAAVGLAVGLGFLIGVTWRR